MKSTLLTAHTDVAPDEGSNRSLRHSWWCYPNLLSLDAPIVAVIWYFAFSKAFDSPFAWQVSSVLFLTVWAIYITDRLLDGLHQNNWSRATLRHRFVHAYQKSFMVLLACILLIAAAIAFKELPHDLIFAGLGLCMVVFLYFVIFVRIFPRLKPARAKEFACGFVFSVGTAIGVDALRQGIVDHPLDVLPPVLLFAGLCIFNCLVIAARERYSDQCNDPGAASNWWHQIDRDLFFLGVGIVVISGVFCVFSSHHSIYLAILSSSLFLTLLHLLQGHFSSSISRVLADTALLIPLLLLI